jgi:hypothetical protein
VKYKETYFAGNVYQVIVILVGLMCGLHLHKCMESPVTHLAVPYDQLCSVNWLITNTPQLFIVTSTVEVAT